MVVRRIVFSLLFVLAAAIGAIALVWSNFASKRIRYRIDTTFEYGGVPIETSAIWEVVYKTQPTFGGALPPLLSRFRGEAPNAKLPDGGVLFVEAARHELGWNLRAQKVYNFPERIPLKLLGLENPWSDVDILGKLSSAANQHPSLEFDLSLLPKVWIAEDPNDLETFFSPSVCNVDAPCELHFVKGLVSFVDEPPISSLANRYSWAKKSASIVSRDTEHLNASHESAYRYMFISEIDERN